MTTNLPAKVRSAPRLAFRGGAFGAGVRQVPEETAVAISVNGSTHAVMMASPEHVGELGIGLALNERIVSTVADIERVEIESSNLGIDCRLWLVDDKADTYTARRRQMTGPVGCGLCGVESLELANRDLEWVPRNGFRVSPIDLAGAMAGMAGEQALSRSTRAVHAAAYHTVENGQTRLVVTREDVGRHNALDKVTGHLAERTIDPATSFITITSRVSVELIQKAAMMRCGLIAAVSAPTALAIRIAADAGITLVAVVRDDEFEIFTHPGRIEGAAKAAGYPTDDENETIPGAAGALAGEGETTDAA